MLTLLILPANNPRPGDKDNDAPLARSRSRTLLFRCGLMILPVPEVGIVGVVDATESTVAAGVGVTVAASPARRRNKQGDEGGDSIA